MSKYLYRFDDFEIDATNRICIRSGNPVLMTGKVFDVLLAFVENPGRLMSKTELLEIVWPGEFVEEGNLARSVSSLRKALGDEPKDFKYIVTVQRKGYRFAAEVSRPMHEPFTPTDNVPARAATEVGLVPPLSFNQARTHKLLWLSAAIIVLFTAAWWAKNHFYSESPTIRSLAVLPLRGLDPNDNYLGVGIADAVIQRVSSSAQLTVRPTSAVLHYLNQDADTITAARELNADAVLEGTVQRSSDRLRVSVNLLRTSDGTSLWADNFDMPAADIFTIQDRVAQQVATRLRIGFDPRKDLGRSSRYPANTEAYEYYLKGIFNLDERGFEAVDKPQMDITIGLFRRSIAADPDFAPAHAQLAYAYAWVYLYIEPAQGRWSDLAKQELEQADALDPNLSETHLARSMLLWTERNSRIEEATRELLRAIQINPDIGHADLAALYASMGLKDSATREIQRAAEIDPASKSIKWMNLVIPWIGRDADAYFVAFQKLPDRHTFAEPWYYLRKGRLDDAKKAIAEWNVRKPGDSYLTMNRMTLLAQNGEFRAAESNVLSTIALEEKNNPGYHHDVYEVACIYALSGNSSEAVKWLRETATTGLPNYPLFAGDPLLDLIRQDPEFIQFLSEQREQFERFKQEFEN